MNTKSANILTRAFLTLIAIGVLGELFLATGLASPENRIEDELQVISAVAPTYPVAIIGGVGPFDLSGEVFVNVDIDEVGDVLSARAPGGHPMLQQLASKAAKRWKFAPAVKGAGTRTVRLHFIFRTLPRGTSDEELSPIFMPPYSVEVRRITVEANLTSRSTGLAISAALILQVDSSPVISSVRFLLCDE
jgi:TonB family protein